MIELRKRGLRDDEIRRCRRCGVRKRIDTVCSTPECAAIWDEYQAEVRASLSAGATGNRGET